MLAQKQLCSVFACATVNSFVLVCQTNLYEEHGFKNNEWNYTFYEVLIIIAIFWKLVKSTIEDFNPKIITFNWGWKTKLFYLEQLKFFHALKYIVL